MPSLCCIESFIYHIANSIRIHAHNVNTQGINLSGGQRQRVSIARAAYANADIYLLDSPLSAVDANVASHIFEKCFIQLLAGKTRILCTNQLQFLPQCDRVLLVRYDGVRSYVSEQGTYSELITQENSELTQLMSSYSITTEHMNDVNVNNIASVTTNGDDSNGNDNVNITSGSVNGRADSDTAVCDAFIHLSDDVSEAGDNFDNDLQADTESIAESVASMQSVYSSLSVNDAPTEEMIAATTTTDDIDASTTGAATTAGTAAEQYDHTTRTTVVTAATTGDSVAGARLVQAEKMATGHVQWQVYKTYFKEGSGGTLLTVTLLTVTSSATTAHSEMPAVSTEGFVYAMTYYSCIAACVNTVILMLL
jgi:ABC-type multidrug transport system ATPase subunit